MGCRANAIRWQVWTALLVYVLLRFAAHPSNWGHSFTRLFTVSQWGGRPRGDLWICWDYYETMGQQAAIFECQDSCIPRGCRDLSLKPSETRGQHCAK